MVATKELYQKLVEEGEQLLCKAKQLEADAELRNLESQRELENSANVRSEADAYREKVIAQTRMQAQEMVQQAQAIKTDAVAYRETLFAQVRGQAQEELDQAHLERLEADAYREKVIAQAQRQAQDILDQARLAAELEGAEIVQKFSVEAEKILAQAQLIKAAAEEQLEAHRLFAEVANLETESKEVLERARAELGREIPLLEDNANHRAPTSDLSLASEIFEASRQEELLQEMAQSAAEGDLSESSSSDEAAEPSEGMYESAVDQSAEDPPENNQTSKERSPIDDNDLVLGIEIDGYAKAYPLEIVTEARVINDSLHNHDVLVTFGPPSELGMIFKRRNKGRSLTFERLPESANGLMLMKDQETETVWEALTGHAVSGPLAPAKLEHVNSEYSFWFAWSEMHPQSEVYSPEETTLSAMTLA